eukprot:EG_transcript_24229
MRRTSRHQIQRVGRRAVHTPHSHRSAANNQHSGTRGPCHSQPGTGGVSLCFEGNSGGRSEAHGHQTHRHTMCVHDGAGTKSRKTTTKRGQRKHMAETIHTNQRTSQPGDRRVTWGLEILEGLGQALVELQAVQVEGGLLALGAERLDDADVDELVLVHLNLDKIIRL